MRIVSRNVARPGRDARRSVVLAVMVSGSWCITGVASAHAQSAAPAPRPAFENLRFREDWSRTPRGDPRDPLKHIALSDGGSIWLSLGGHVRLRGESVDGFLAGGPGTREDGFGLLRTHLHADLHIGRHVRGFFEGRYAEVSGRELPGGARALDRNRGDWGNAFVEVAGTTSGITSAARVGRQELLLGRERIVSPLDWANVRRVFEGVTLESKRGPVTVGLLGVRPLKVLADRADVSDKATVLWGGTLAWQSAQRGRVLEGAMLMKQVDAIGTAPSARRATAAGRLLTPVGRRDLVLELEGGIQRVHGGADVTTASMIASDLTWSPAARWAPAVTVGADRASGTRAGQATQSGTWDQLYPLGHAYAGFADVLGRRNLVEERLVVQFSPHHQARVRTAFHAFQRASRADAAYDVGGGIFRAPGVNASARIGTEVDATIQWRLGRHLRLDGGVSRFMPGQFLRDTGSARRYSFVFSSVTATF